MGYWADKYMGIHTAKRRSLKLLKLLRYKGRKRGLKTGDLTKDGGALFPLVIPDMASCELSSASEVGSG